ncbi:hypothetical protein RS022_00320 [Candidatus Phytoplasma rubi]|uniref:Uncharacterized protein n=1 Tax=Candidatus Phytoplasma rubi TaxID=399025 RepID=A0ABY7BQH1_9MOLU|nr:hypothetical protein RS022_00320 [Candidatus Phytoplasma rubi]
MKKKKKTNLRVSLKNFLKSKKCPNFWNGEHPPPPSPPHPPYHQTF